MNMGPYVNSEGLRKDNWRGIPALGVTLGLGCPSFTGPLASLLGWPKLKPSVGQWALTQWVSRGDAKLSQTLKFPNMSRTYKDVICKQIKYFRVSQ